MNEENAPAAVVIGASTGGPRVLREMVAFLPRSLPLPVIVVQHMPDRFVASFARGLARISPLPVEEAAHLGRIEPGRIYIAPGGCHTRFERRASAVFARLSSKPDGLPFRPSIDVLFESSAETLGRRVMAVVLTGLSTGERTDGVIGCRKVMEKGGITLAQDEASSPCWGMAESCLRAGVISRVVDLPDLPRAIVTQANLWIRKAGGARPLGKQNAQEA